MSPDGERRARVALSFLAQPGDPVFGAALRTRSANDLLALVIGADANGEALLAAQAGGCRVKPGAATLAGQVGRSAERRPARRLAAKRVESDHPW